MSSNSGLEYDNVSGLLVADKLNKKPQNINFLARLAQDDMKALEWEVLLERASKQWAEFLEILVARSPDDDRLSKLRSG